MTVMKLPEAANLFSRLSKVYGLLSLQDLLDRVPSEVEHSPADSSAEVRYGIYGCVPVTVAIPNEVRGA
jgi:hypothetical protein